MPDIMNNNKYFYDFFIIQTVITLEKVKALYSILVIRMKEIIQTSAKKCRWTLVLKTKRNYCQIA